VSRRALAALVLGCGAGFLVHAIHQHRTGQGARAVHVVGVGAGTAAAIYFWNVDPAGLFK
jgi:uncharacterized membrane protein YeaQ/YmgE (transglycosylase-associated protein family)